MLKDPMRILIGVVIFIVVVAALYFLLGAPACDSLANQTAYQLVSTINLVAEKVPAYLGNDVPQDSGYYLTAPIRLCQEHAKLSYFQSFVGGAPEYQIYYETFPEGFFKGGAGLWTEAYPWSGGAAQTFVFWGVLRTGKALLKGVKVINLAKAEAAWKGGKAIINAERSAAKHMKEKGVIKLLKDTENLQNQFMKDPETVGRGVSAYAFGHAINKETAPSVIRGWGELLDDVEIIEFILKTESTIGPENAMYKAVSKITKNGKLPLKKTKIPIKMTAIENGVEVEKYLFVKKDAEGIITDTMMSSYPSPQAGWTLFEESPANMFKEYVDTMATRQEKEFLLEMFEPDWKDADIIKITSEEAIKATKDGIIDETKLAASEITKIGLWKRFKTQLGKISADLKRIKAAGYDIEKNIDTPIENKARAIALADWLKADENNFKLLEELHPYSRFKFRIAKALSISEDRVTRNSYYKYLNEVMEKTGAISLIPKESKWNIFKVSMRIAKENNGVIDSAIVKKTLQDEGFEFAENEIADISKLIESKWSVSELTFATDANRAFLEKYMSDPKERMMLIGFLEQNVNVMPMTWQKAALKYEAKKLLYLDGTQLIPVNPGYITKSYAMAAMTEGCLGNSICTYSHNAQMETPFYLSEKAQEYFVRVWRPVNPAKHIGIQAALMWVPEHPRFYVASPCLAIAKIWKTEYGGQKTIFVKPEKCGTEASNYCYADEGLIDQYTLIWDASDAGTIIESILTGGTATLLKTVVKSTDPVTLAQAAAEAAISWPGYPWTELNYDKMSSTAGTCIWEPVKEALNKTE